MELVGVAFSPDAGAVVLDLVSVDVVVVLGFVAVADSVTVFTPVAIEVEIVVASAAEVV